MKKLGSALLLATFAGLALEAAAAEKKPPAPPPILETYARFVTYSKHSMGKFLKITLTFTSATDGKRVDFVMPEMDATTQKPVVWDDAAKAKMNSLKAAELYDVHYNVQNGVNVCMAFDPYTPTPGEDEPNVFIFSKKGDPINKKGDPLNGMPTVEVTKFKTPVKFVVPPAKGPGKPVPDPKMLDALNKFKPNDLVQAEPDPRGVLKVLKLWEPPKMADLNAISAKPNEKGFTTIEVTDVVDTKTLVVPKNKMSMVGKLRPLLRENAKSKSVLYHATPDEKDPSIVWVDDIKPTPENYVAPEVASSKTPAESGGGGGTEKEGVFWSTGKMKAFRSDDTVDYIEIQTPGPDAEHVMREKYMVSLKDATTVMPKVKDMKQGATVTFKFSDSLQGKWMSDIKVKDVKPPATKSAEKKPPEDPKKTGKPAEKPE